MLHLFLAEKGSITDIDGTIIGYGSASYAPIFTVKGDYVNTQLGNCVSADIFYGLRVEDESGRVSECDAIITGKKFWYSADGPFGMLKGRTTKMFFSYRRDIIAYLDYKILRKDQPGYASDNEVYAIAAAIAERDKTGWFKRKTFIANIMRYKESLMWQNNKVISKICASEDAFADTEDASIIRNRTLRLRKSVPKIMSNSNALGLEDDDVEGLLDDLSDQLDNLGIVSN